MKKVNQKLFSIQTYVQNSLALWDDSHKMLGYHPLKHPIMVKQVDEGQIC